MAGLLDFLEALRSGADWAKRDIQKIGADPVASAKGAGTGFVKGVSTDLLGMPVDTGVNLYNLGKAGVGTVGGLFGMRPENLPALTEKKDVPGSSEWLEEQVRKRGGGQFIDAPAGSSEIASLLGNVIAPGPKGAKAPQKLEVMTYHGSPNLFDTFDATKAGKSGGTSFGLGHNLSADKGHASAYKGDNGNLYKVDLADESLPKFLQWESTAPKQLTAELPPIDKGKPIQFGGGATLEKSKNGWLLKTGDAAFPLRDSEFNRMFGDANTGEQVYRKLVASLGSEDAASAWLRARGVPGIVNNTERGATNYAVFPGNEHLLKILGRE